MQGRINQKYMGWPLALALVAWLSAALAATAAVAQTAPGSNDKPAPKSYVAEVVADGGSDIYAGGGWQYYTVGKIKKGQRVVVRRELFQWFQVVPPAGVYSYVSKAHVNANGDGKRGTINRPHVNITTAALDGPGVSYVSQVHLDKGDAVRIVAEEGSFYKIQPPADATVWLPPNSLRKVEGAAVDAAGQTDGETPVVKKTDPKPEPTPEPTGETVVAPTDPPTDRMPEPNADTNDDQTTAPIDDDMEIVETPAVVDGEETANDAVTTIDSNKAITTADAADDPQATTAERSIYAISVDAESPAVQALETRLLQAGRQPLADQPLDELIAAYADVLKQAELTVLDQRIVGARIEQLTRQAEIAKLLKSLKQTQDTIAAASDVPVEENKPKPRTAYNAVGQLLASGVYDGQSAPLLFRIVEPANLRTIAYIRPDDDFDSASGMGKVVGVIGDISYDPTLKLRVLDVETLDVLDN